MGAWSKAFKNIVSRPSAASKVISSAADKAYLADRAALKAGAKYIDIGSAPSQFNASGFLPKTSK